MRNILTFVALKCKPRSKNFLVKSLGKRYEMLMLSTKFRRIKSKVSWDWITNNIIKLESNIISNNKSFISKKSKHLWINWKFKFSSKIQIWNKSNNQSEVIIFISQCYCMIKSLLYNLKVLTSLFNHRMAMKLKW